MYNKKHKEEIIVAVIDTKLDIKHEDIKNQIWSNENEVPDNGIDDDKNGYIDDIHGWNFLGNTEGQEITYSNYESMRIIQKYDSMYSTNPKDTTSFNFKQYQKAKKAYEQVYTQKLKNQEARERITINFTKYVDTVQHFFGDKRYTVNELDSLRTILKKDSILDTAIRFMRYYKKNNLTPEELQKRYKKAAADLDISLNFEFNDRSITGDNPNDISDIKYGNNQVWNDSITFQHAIQVSGVLAGNRTNNKGVIGVTNTAKIMALCVASSGGDEHDKDIALAIRYAVNNGAKIINMSFGKPLSLQRTWIDQALQYAEAKDVLVVCSAGNGRSELTPDNIHYPTDYDELGNMIVENMIKVGATTKYVDKRFRAYFSNYSKQYVEIFAPGADIYSTKHNQKYGFVNGTSYAAPIVSGIAALVMSYYPELKASDVKKILMESGTKYHIDVAVRDGKGSKKTLPFSELSKSGKVVNAYNALLMAEKMSKK